MTTLLEGARSFATRGTDLGGRIEGLERAVGAAEGRLDGALVQQAADVAGRAAGRVRLSAQHTVVAIAGATGSGKSSTFNALTGLELSSTGVRRPTTSWATACVWGSEGADELLQWLGIPPRHQTMRGSMLDTGLDDHALDGVVLLDLPDHDSTEVSHHLEVDRLVQLADLLVWVLDPQKYADAAIHDRYLAPLAAHAGVMLVVLNHIDTVPVDRRDAMVADVRRLLAADGLAEVHVVGVSAREGIGVDALRAEIADRVEAKRSTRERITTDLRSAAERLDAASGGGRVRELQDRRVRDLEQSLGELAGTPTAVASVERVARRRLRAATGWPPVTLLASALRRGPGEGMPDELAGGDRQAATAPVSVQRSQVDVELRSAADDAAAGLGQPWVEAVERAALARRDDVAQGLETVLADGDLRAVRLPAWAQAVRVLQWLLLLVGVAGGVWFGVLAAQGALDDAPQVAGQPLALVMLVAGLGLGVVLALVCLTLVGRAARDRAEAVAGRVGDEVHRLTNELVAEPVGAELQRYAAFRSGLAAALK